MRFGSILAIYFLIWSTTAFAVLPWGVRTAEEAGQEKVPGQAEGAPVAPSLGRKALWTTIISAAIFALFYVAFSQGWLSLDTILPGLTPGR